MSSYWRTYHQLTSVQTVRENSSKASEEARLKHVLVLESYAAITSITKHHIAAGDPRVRAENAMPCE